MLSLFISANCHAVSQQNITILKMEMSYPSYFNVDDNVLGFKGEKGLRVCSITHYQSLIINH